MSCTLSYCTNVAYSVKHPHAWHKCSRKWQMRLVISILSLCHVNRGWNNPSTFDGVRQIWISATDWNVDSGLRIYIRFGKLMHDSRIDWRKCSHIIITCYFFISNSTAKGYNMQKIDRFMTFPHFVFVFQLNVLMCWALINPLAY
jgi:hypothetical protein